VPPPEEEQTMPETIAVIADSHLPDCRGSAQEAALRWAVESCLERNITVIAGTGDLTTGGDLPTAQRVVDAMDGVGIPLVQTPGNAELRRPHDAGRVRAMFSTPDAFHGDGWSLITLDTADQAVAEPEKGRFEQRLAEVNEAAVVTHCPPQAWPPEDRVWLESLCRRGCISLILVGHKHFDATGNLGGVPVHVVRGLDPDKAKHAPPGIAIFSRGNGTWSREDISFPETDPRHWSPAAKREFIDLLGVSTMTRTMADLAEAAEAAVACLELRADLALNDDDERLRDLVQVWRDNGGTTLSLHLPNLRWDVAAQQVTGTDTFAGAVGLALDLGAERVTVHVPRASVAQMAPGGVAWEAMADAFVNGLRPLNDAGLTIGIENLHMNEGEPTDGTRGFGYLPDECMAWVRLLRKRLGNAPIGLHLDLGHARNNAPFSSEWILGRWYAEVGTEAVGYHLHQVNGSGNHQPIHAPFGPLISLASFFWAWNSGQLNHAPMFLEIRNEPGRASRDCLRAFVG
jgi:hypothetical protein